MSLAAGNKIYARMDPFCVTRLSMETSPIAIASKGRETVFFLLSINAGQRQKVIVGRDLDEAEFCIMETIAREACRSQLLDQKGRCIDKVLGEQKIYLTSSFVCFRR